MSYAGVDGKDTIIFIEPESGSESIPAIEEKAEDSKEATNAEESSSEEAQAAAFAPETGEINWDCPCEYSFRFL
jgi:hypothetical protein